MFIRTILGKEKFTFTANRSLLVQVTTRKVAAKCVAKELLIWSFTFLGKWRSRAISFLKLAPAFSEPIKLPRTTNSKQFQLLRIHSEIITFRGKSEMAKRSPSNESGSDDGYNSDREMQREKLRLINRDTLEFKKKYNVLELLNNSANGVIYSGMFMSKIRHFCLKLTPFHHFNTIYFRNTHWRRRICSYQTSIQSKDSWLCYGWRATSSKRISHSSSGIKHSGRCQSFWVVWTTNNVSLYTLELNLEHL